MKKILSVFIAVFSLSAIANNEVWKPVDFDFFQPTRDNWGNQVFYACDVVENRTRGILKELGAEDITVRCSGGIQNWGWNWNAFPISLRADYKVLESADSADYQTVEFSDWGDNSSCELNVKLIKELLETFNAKDVNVSSFCRGTRGRYTISASVLKLDTAQNFL